MACKGTRWHASLSSVAVPHAFRFQGNRHPQRRDGVTSSPQAHPNEPHPPNAAKTRRCRGIAASGTWMCRDPECGQEARPRGERYPGTGAAPSEVVPSEVAVSEVERL